MFKRLVNQVIQFFTGIQVKIFLACSLVAIISMGIATYSTYKNSAKVIEKNAIDYIYESMLHADENLRVMLEDIEKISTVIVINRNNVINVIMSPNFPASYEWALEKKRMEDFLGSLMAYKPYILRASVVALNGKIYQSGGSLIRKTVLEQPWVKDIVKKNKRQILYNIGDGQSISMVRPIYFENRPIGFVMIDFNPDIIKKVYDIKPLSSESYIITVTKQGEFLNSSGNIKDTLFRQAFIEARHASVPREFDIQRKKYIMVSCTSNYSGLITIGLIHHEKLIRDTMIIRNQMIKNLVMVFLIVLIISVLVSNRISKNLKRLSNTMMLVKNGDLTARPNIHSKDEVEKLSDGFTVMMEKINSLMEDIKIEEQQKREAELKALHSQIGPHFIYNTLNTIKYLARLQNIANIDQIAGALIELLRSVLGNTRETVSIREELEYVKSYLLIQRYKFLDRVKVFFDVEEEILDCKVLKLVLQPIVENALIHGTANLNEGTILIKAYRGEGIIIFEVIDNGIGMHQEQIDRIMNGTMEDVRGRFSGIGLKNVDQRIKLAFGNQFGLKLSSCSGVYTSVEITIPEIRTEVKPYVS